MSSLPADEWRVEVDLDDEAHGYSLGERLRSHNLDDEARERLGGRVIVTRDGPRLYLYTASEAGAREAERVIRELLDADKLTAEVTVTHWSEAADDWVSPTEPVGAAPAGPSVIEDHDWFVLAEPPEGADVEAIAERLHAAGHPVERRWQYLAVGASSEQDASAIAGRLRSDLGPSARVEVRAQVEVGSPGFVLLESFFDR
jgi:hypothetical protein